MQDHIEYTPSVLRALVLPTHDTLVPSPPSATRIQGRVVSASFTAGDSPPPSPPAMASVQLADGRSLQGEGRVRGGGAVGVGRGGCGLRLGLG